MQENSSDYYSHLLNTHHFAQADIKEDGARLREGLVAKPSFSKWRTK